MKPSIKIAREACEKLGARQVVLIAFDDACRFAVVSYGETKAECVAVRPLCDAIADGIAAGHLPSPAPRTRPAAPAVDRQKS